MLKIEPNKTGKIEKPLFLNGSEIDYSQEETHLGIKRTDDGKPKATITSKITTSRRAAYALMGAGLHGLNGVSPETSTAMVNTYINQILMSGLDALCLGEKDYELLESHHLKLLRILKHTASSHLNSKTSTVSAFGIPTTGGNTSSTSFITIWQDCTKTQLYRM